jgi:hypothetical protein
MSRRWVMVVSSVTDVVGDVEKVAIGFKEIRRGVEKDLQGVNLSI